VAELLFAERLIGTIRRECVDHVVALGEQHLRQVLKSYARYYNTARTHRSLNKDAPISRPVQQIGHIVSHALVGLSGPMATMTAPAM
jgi:Integrase core domain